MDVRLVINATASGTKAPEGLTGALRDAGARVDTRVTHDLAELAAALAPDGRRVVLAGGDGTLHAAVNARDDLPDLAILPLGRANNIARALGIPDRLADAGRVAVQERARPLDVLRVTDAHGTRLCLEAVSVGLQADARARYDAPNSADLLAGARALLAAVHGFRPYAAALFVDGEATHPGPAAQIFLSNLPFFGFGFRVDPLADPADGLLEAIVLEAGTRREVLSLLGAVRRGRHLERAGATIVRGHEARIDGAPPLAGDGEPLGRGGVSVSVEQGRLRLAAPWR
jgi:diacylglycerol kinase (ATP)